MNRKKTICYFLSTVMVIMLMADTSYAVSVPKLSKKSLKLKVGEKKKIKIKNAGKVSKFKWKSGKPSVASVNKNGVVSAKKAGKTKITVRVKKRTLTCSVVVSKAAKKPGAGTASSPKPTSASPVGTGAGLNRTEAPQTGSPTSVNTLTPSTEPTEAPKRPDYTFAPADDFVGQMSNFSVALLQNTAGEDIVSGQNVLISPESVITALMMTANGADGGTKAEMDKVLCGNVGHDEFGQNLSAFNWDLTDSEKVKFHIANSIWVRDDADRIQLNEDFLKKNQELYLAEAFLRPFDESTVGEINGWVKEHTSDMIPRMINDISDYTVMFLINALAFEGRWSDPYNEYSVDEKGKFINHAGNEQNATMLNGSERSYIHDDNAEGFIKDYQGGKYAFLAILPKKELGVDGYLKSMTGETLQKIYKSREGKLVYTKMPEFSYEYEKSLKPSLAAMGMGSAFEENADFTKMAATRTGKLFVSDVLHKTFIELDRNGTKAAAATVVIGNDATSVVDPEEPKRVYLDRPFLYAIVETKTGLPIFMGAVNSLKFSGADLKK